MAKTNFQILSRKRRRFDKNKVEPVDSKSTYGATDDANGDNVSLKLLKVNIFLW